MKSSVMLAQLEEHLDYMRGLLAGLDEPHLARPPARGKMSLRQTVAHLAHTNELFAERLEQMLTIEAPPVKVIDSQSERLKDYEKIEIGKLVGNFSKARKKVIERLAKLYPHEWQRAAVHPEYHHYNVQMAVEHLLLHEAHHLYKMERLRAALDRWDQR